MLNLFPSANTAHQRRMKVFKSDTLKTLRQLKHSKKMKKLQEDEVPSATVGAVTFGMPSPKQNCRRSCRSRAHIWRHELYRGFD